MKNYFKILPILFLSLLTVSCGDDNDDNGVCCAGSSIVDLASQTESLSTLVAALEVTGLDATLSSPGAFTVLAPTNDAFDSFLTSINAASLEDIPVDVLTNVLLNHVIIGEAQSSSLTNGYASTQADSAASGTNMSIYINTDDGVTFNGVSSVTSADVVASNGIVHIVDAVIGGVIYSFTESEFLLNNSIFSNIFSLVTLIGWISLTSRRLQDNGHSGWWQLAYFSIIPTIILWVLFAGFDGNPVLLSFSIIFTVATLGLYILILVWLILPPTIDENRWGRNPLLD